MSFLALVPFSLGMPELVIIFMAGLLVFGPRSVPTLGRSLGRGIREFRLASQRLTDPPALIDEDDADTDPDAPLGGNRTGALKP